VERVCHAGKEAWVVFLKLNSPHYLMMKTMHSHARRSPVLYSSMIFHFLVQFIISLKKYSVKEYSSPTQGGARFALQVGFRTPERIGPRTMTLVAGSLQYLRNQSNQVRKDMRRLHGALCLTGVKETYST
jgi:hypothetical protein